MSTIKVYLVGSEQVKGHASETKWKQRSLSVKVITRILRTFIVTLYIYQKLVHITRRANSFLIFIQPSLFHRRFFFHIPAKEIVKTTE